MIALASKNAILIVELPATFTGRHVITCRVEATSRRFLPL